MASTGIIPAAVHAGAGELPFVDIGDGSMLKVIQVKAREGLCFVEIFSSRPSSRRLTSTPDACTASRRRALGSMRSTTT